MIVCSCNVLSDHDVRAAVTAASDTPRTAKQVYGCLGCSAECGRCARTIKQIMSEALTGALTEALADKLETCTTACCSGCPRSHHHEEAAVSVDAVAAAADVDAQAIVTA